MNNGVTKVFGGMPNTARETRTLPFGRTAAVPAAARGQARWRHRANGCRRAGQTGREMRYDGCPRACAARFTLGYNMAGLQPLGGARLCAIAPAAAMAERSAASDYFTRPLQSTLLRLVFDTAALRRQGQT